MATGIFFSEQWLKENSAIDENVDMKYIRITIEECQKLHILTILGTALYNEINTQVVAGSVTSLNQTLLNDYIQPALKYWVLYEGIDLFHFKITNKAIMKKNSDNSQPIEISEIERLMDRHKHKAEEFSQRLTNYLLANTTSYPLYWNPGSTYDTIHPDMNNYSTGWVLDDTAQGYKDIETARSKFYPYK